ncbi:zinc ribbon domain-containing protein [Canibacter zhoujuaniae]|uniref:zinc ribbon domain-containing protein n=1 Tax=Canibacter zhoujuaniae TaxID=2708343 RepID=UPI0014201D9D|nr:hypothetical protein [Canibacter zhoujuaniae]
MKASREQQLALLELAKLDTEVARHNRSLKQLPQIAKLRELETQAATARAHYLEAQRALEAAEVQEKRTSDDIETVLKRLTQDEKRLTAASDAKLAQNLQHEIATLLTRKENLELQELELGEITADAQKNLAETKAVLDAIATQGKETQQEAKAAAAEIRAQLEATQEERLNKETRIPKELLTEYEEMRGRTGIGAAALRNGVSEASNMKLSPGELAEINAIPEDEIIYDPQTGVILVRI